MRLERDGLEKSTATNHSRIRMFSVSLSGELTQTVPKPILNRVNVIEDEYD